MREKGMLGGHTIVPVPTALSVPPKPDVIACGPIYVLQAKLLCSKRMVLPRARTETANSFVTMYRHYMYPKATEIY